MNADAQPGALRGRRVSCTVALAVAGALAAVTVGSGLLSGLLPDSDATKKPSTDAAAPSRSGSPSSPAPGGQLGGLPKAFAGTWKGPLTERSGAPHGTLTAVFTEGRKGSDVARMKVSLTVLGTTVTCNSIGALSSATARVVKIRERLDPGKPSSAGLCTGDAADIAFTLTPEGTLAYQSYEEGAGRPHGTLTRSGG